MTSNTALTDARGGLPSASAMTRIFNCPASYKLNAAETPETSAAAEEGRLLHRVMELAIQKFPEDIHEEMRADFDDVKSRLSDEQEQTFNTACWLVSRNVVDGFRAGDETGNVEFYEKRFWAASKLFSGQGDAVFIKDNGEATIVDYKFGRGEVEPAERNYQLAAMAVLVADNFNGLSTIRAMIIQPRALDKGKRITECVYTKDDVDAAREAINAACKEAIDAETPTQKCGYWCKYCPSAYRCKAAQDALNVQFKIATASPSFAIGKHNALDMFNKAVLVKNFCEAVLEKIKTFIANNPDADCGLELTKGARRAKLGDTAKVFDAVCGAGIAPEEFVEVCKVESGKLLSLYYNKRKLVNEKITKKASDAELKSRLESKGLLTYMEAAPTLKLLEDRQ